MLPCHSGLPEPAGWDHKRGSFGILFGCQRNVQWIFPEKAEQNGNYRELIQDHEGKLSIIFDIMLYGIAKEPTEVKED